MPTKYVDVGSYATYYYHTGATTLPDVIPDLSRGRTIVLLHAAGSNAHTWHNQYDFLGRSHSPLAPDLPAHGRSSGVEALPSLGAYTDFVVAFLDALEIKSAVLAGRSMGGAVAMDLAIRYPQRVSALMLLATAAKFTLPAEWIATWRNVTMGRSGQPFDNAGYSPKTIADHPEIIREGWGEQIRTDPRTRWGDMVAVSNVDLRESISRITQPTLILAGRDDTTTPLSESEFLESRIKGARLEIIDHAAHYLTTEQPAQVNAALGGFLDSLH